MLFSYDIDGRVGHRQNSFYWVPCFGASLQNDKLCEISLILAVSCCFLTSIT